MGVNYKARHYALIFTGVIRYFEVFGIRFMFKKDIFNTVIKNAMVSAHLSPYSF